MKKQVHQTVNSAAESISAVKIILVLRFVISIRIISVMRGLKTISEA